MPPNYPGSLDALANPSASTLRNEPGYELHAVISTLNDIAEALETKLGTGASAPGGAAAVLRRTADGASAWEKVAAGDYAPASIAAADLQGGLLGLVKLAEVVGTGSSPFMQISGIPQIYRRLSVQVVGRGTAAGLATTTLTFETTPTAGSYYHQRLYGQTTTAGAAESLGVNGIMAGLIPGTTAGAGLHGTALISLPEYANTGIWKSVEVTAGSLTSGASNGLLADQVVGFWTTTAGISLVRVTLSGGNWTTTSRMTLYGWSA